MKCDCAYRADTSAECPTCTGEAAFLCTREGKELRLCTRCTLPRDVMVARLYDEADIPRLVELDAEVGPGPFDAIMDLFGGQAALLRYKLDLPRECRPRPK